MNYNIKITLQSLIELGLDISSGISPEIYIITLEKHSGLRQTSNGSRIIRRDSTIFGLFNIDWKYSPTDGRLISVTFNGYKTREDIENNLQDEIGRLQSKVESLNEKIRDNNLLLDWVATNGSDLSVEDLLLVLKVS